MSAWLDQMFDAEAADRGDIIRRNICDVQQYASLTELLDECKARDYHLIETGDQYVVVCNSGVLKIHC